ncbi:MAG: hypothetical protein JST12_05635 [Armatimonadetes bacterium]|nr:hypothetical protein [Armatimonadota bacterium]
MRFEINVPDTTGRKLKARLAKLTKRLSKNPKLVKEIPLDDDEDENLKHLFTPERLAELDQICAELDAGAKTYTAKEVDAYLETKRKAWHNRHAD